MSEHHARINWQRGNTPFEYDLYPRDHDWQFPGGLTVPASAAPGFLGSEEPVDPEEAFIAALSSCHMLTFLAIAAKKRLSVESYIDNAVGYLEKNAAGQLCVTRVELHPEVVWTEAGAVTVEQYHKLHDSAHQNCFIANSVKTLVTCVFD